MKLAKLILVMMLLVVFMAGCKKDDDPGVRPIVTSTNPVSNAVNIAINSDVTVTFNGPMDPATIAENNFTVKQGTTTVSGTVGYNSMGMAATFNPAADFKANMVYTVTISGAKNGSGTGMLKDYVWSFTTGSTPDITLPTVTLNPLNSATAVALNQKIVATFSELMDFTTINASTFKVRQNNTVADGTITYNGTAAIFTSTNPLEPDKVYTVTITSGAKDMVGNALASNNTASFTTASATDVTLPMVIATGPLDNAVNVARDKVIAITFSEEMDPSTINEATFLVKKGIAVVQGVIEYSGATATFKPTPIFDAGATYMVTITKEAKDLAGNALAANTVFDFKTNAGLSLAKIDLGAAGNYVILAQSAITNVPTSSVTGDLGLSPAATSFITGFALTNATGYATASQVTGKIYAAPMAAPTPDNLTTAVNNMSAAYTDAAGRPSPDFSEYSLGNIGGKTLVPGLYNWTTTVTMPAAVTLSGDGTDVWIFQIAGDLTMSAGVKIILQGGAQAKNIFWQVAGQVTLGTTSHFEGIILSKTAITLKTGASMNGRALAQTEVILDQNVVTKPQ